MEIRREHGRFFPPSVVSICMVAWGLWSVPIRHLITNQRYLFMYMRICIRLLQVAPHPYIVMCPRLHPLKPCVLLRYVEEPGWTKAGEDWVLVYTCTCIERRLPTDWMRDSQMRSRLGRQRGIAGTCDPIGQLYLYHMYICTYRQ